MRTLTRQCHAVGAHDCHVVAAVGKVAVRANSFEEDVDTAALTLALRIRSSHCAPARNGSPQREADQALRSISSFGWQPGAHRCSPRGLPHEATTCRSQTGQTQAATGRTRIKSRSHRQSCATPAAAADPGDGATAARPRRAGLLPARPAGRQMWRGLMVARAFGSRLCPSAWHIRMANPAPGKSSLIH